MIRILISILAIVFLANCKYTRTQTPIQKANPHCQYLAKYFNEDSSSFCSHVTLNDSDKIYSLGLLFYYFSDHRREPKYWKTGVLVKDRLGNSYVFSQRVVGYPVEGGGTIDMSSPRIQPIQIKNEFSCRTIDFLSQEQIPEAIKVSSLLTNLPDKEKEGINKAGLDSFFKFYFKQEKLQSIQSQNSFDSLIQVITISITNVAYDAPSQRHNKNVANFKLNKLERLKIFRKLVDGNFQEPNYFLYQTWDRNIWLITINETFVDYKESNIFYDQITNDKGMFDVRIYEIINPI